MIDFPRRFRAKSVAHGSFPLRGALNQPYAVEDVAMARPAVFLDRDGVLIEDVHYLAHPDQVQLIPGSAQAISQLNTRGVPVIVVTNQAGVARGYFPESRVAEVHGRIDELLAAAGARIDRYYYCPHHPTAGSGSYRVACECRKPRPGMLHRAAMDLKIDLARSYLVGDKISDLEAAMHAGCCPMLVRTGDGDAAAQEAHPVLLRASINNSVVEAVADCLANLLSQRRAA
jgi:D-glycero-D-manno-heptose 1,7-bisphosphate phosphatase